ncbi:MAG: prepilin-type N-terminal cleavage/methylation domain-containing protein [Desulfosarcina sp.]|nr:prepilin-type N-terminal cleavage/methylation domain-containing protein [Desulfobacterales bacterium]
MKCSEWKINCPLKNKNGFTLIELLITFTIFAISIAILFSGLRLGIRAWEKGEQDINNRQRYRIVLDLLKRQIKSAYPYYRKDETDKFLLFNGKTKSLEFVSSLSLLPGGARGLVYVKYKVQEDRGTDKTKLIFKEDFKYLLTNESKTDTDESYTSLLDNITYFEFEYFGKADENDSAIWHDEWDAEEIKTLPAAVKIKLKTDPKTDQLTVIIPIPAEIPDQPAR